MVSCEMSVVLLITCVLATSFAKDTYMFYFDGTRYISYDLPPSNHSVEAKLDISFRMWADSPEGVLFYSYADPGDVLSLELHDKSFFKRIYYASAQSGSGTLSSGSGIGLHEDEEWMNVSLKIDQNGTVYDVSLATITSPQPHSVRLGPKIYIGGYSSQKKGIESHQYYKGCLEDFVLNGVNVFEEIRKSEENTGSTSGFPSECPMIVSYMSFYGIDSFLKIPAQDAPEAKLTNISFEFRTFDSNATLMLMELGATNISVEFKENSTIVFRTSSRGFGFDNSYPLGFDLGDGEYHRLEVEVDTAGLTVSLDDFSKHDKQMKAPRGYDTQAYFIGGFPGDIGYKGCLRELRVNNNRFRVSELSPENVENVTLGRCLLIDRCYQPAKRCTHGGKCIRNRDDFFCNCSGTGYKGPSCHTPMHPPSCAEVKITSSSGQQIATIDVDGPGPIKPTEVICSKDKQNGIITTRIRSKVGVTRVQGHQDPGSYIQNITYGMAEQEAVGIIDRAESCRQYVRYKCNQARLMASPEGSSLPFGWWVGRDNTPHYDWGGAPADSRSCACSTMENGCLGGLPCNCDAQQSFEVSDDGEFTNKSLLPVTQVRFGDTGKTNSYASYQIGDVECTGQATLEQTITIQKLGAYVNVSKYLGNSPLDVSLEFKTTLQKAQLLYAKGSGKTEHYISIVMEDPSRISVRMRFSRGTINHVEKLPHKLNNNKWQRLYLEMTHKHVLLSVGGHSVVLWKSEQWGFYVFLSTGRPIMIGGNPNGTYGFLGCLRGLMLKGKSVNLAQIVETDKPEGVVKGVLLKDSNNNFLLGTCTVAFFNRGCVGQCESMSLCQNSGKCTEYYATYMCDCASSAFTGCYCGHAIGVRFYVGSWMMFKIQDRVQASLEYLQLHFKSNRPQGVLAHMTNRRDKAILTVELNLRGGVDISYDDGTGSWGLFTSVDGLADGNPHRITIRVTKHPSQSKQTWDVEFDDDLQTTKASLTRHVPKRLYLASKSSSSASSGFDGCIFGLLYNGVPLLKEAKEQPTPDWIAFSNKVSLDQNDCGESENHLTTPSSVPEGPTLSDNSRRPVMITRFRTESVDPPQSSVVSHFMSLVCESVGYPEPRYIIRQNDGPMTCPHLLVDLNTVLLPPDSRVDGRYQCLALNDWGKSMSEELSIGVPKLGEVASLNEESFFMREGQYLRLRCNVTVESLPEASTVWTGADIKDNMADRFYQGLDGDLHILWVLPEDSKVFRCYKVNSQTGGRVEVKRVQLQVNPVQDPSEYTNSGSNELVYSSQSQMFVDIGSAAVLECLVVGHPMPSMSWSYEGNATDNSTTRVELRGRRLVISVFQTVHQGEYQCNVDGLVMSSIVLSKSLKPRWLRGPEPISVYQDDDVKLYCMTSPLPEHAAVDTEWFINGELLQLKPTYALNTQGDVLTIKKASKLTDIITYQCNVSNQYGYLYGEGYLNVHLGTTMVTTPSDQTITPREQFVRFVVAVSADPGSHVTFTWYHDNNVMISNDTEIYKIYTEATKSALVVDLTTVDKEKDWEKYAGIYTCAIFDEVRKKNVSAELKIIASSSDGAYTTAASESIYTNHLTIVITSFIAVLLGQQLINKIIGLNSIS